jgi:hypothetical protein
MEQRDFIKAFKKRGMTALENEEPFEAYIYLWLAFLQSCAPDNVGRITSDRNDIIKPWNIRNFQRVNDLLRNTKLKSNLDWLSKRHEGCIINPEGRHEKDVNRFKLLSSKIRGSYDLFHRPKDISYALLDLCLCVRNNLFHGGKSFYDYNDRQLLKNLCPILISLIEINMPPSRNASE